MSYMKLIKLLYLADRQALSQWNEPITGDRYFSLPRGPVLATVLDQVSAGSGPEDPLPGWSELISPQPNYEVALLREPPNDELSKRELDLLTATHRQFRDMDRWAMVEYCHTLPEWEDPNGSSLPITVERILSVIGKSEDEIEQVEEDTIYFKEARDLLAAP